MTLAQIEKNLNEVITNFNANTFIYDFLLAFNTPKSAIQRLQKGQLNLSTLEGEIIWKKKIFFKIVSAEEVQPVLNTIISNLSVANKNQIRFVIVTDNTNLAAIDTKTLQKISTPIANLANEINFFLPLAGMEKYTAQAENDADVKAAVQMAKLFDEIKKTNPTNTTEEVHNLNIFLSRLLFCFFAEDTGIFEKDLFKNYIYQYTAPDGSNLQQYLQELFTVLNTIERNSKTPFYAKAFPYVNGGLFKTKIPLPTFTSKSRQAILDSAGEYWAEINPDIFGSMIQAVVTPDKRGNLGMHYTSVPNIMKVIKPLFLDELYEEFEAAKNNPTALNKLLGRMANIRIFDPACGSGNFLIIAYKELRLLEIKILLALNGTTTNNLTGFEEKQRTLFAKPQLSLDSQLQNVNLPAANRSLPTALLQTANRKLPTAQMELFSRIELNHFYGIELDDFAHEVAKLSLWLAQHQMNVEFNKLIGTNCNTLPLSDAGVIIQGNATRLDWEMVCPKPKVGEVFILGNPPYLGYSMQSIEQKEDMEFVFKKLKEYKSLDFISCWIYKAAFYIKDINAEFAFVSTNSICQGEQVALLWPHIFDKNLEIGFAYTSFKWSNNAKANAGVTVVVIGLRNLATKKKFIFNNNVKKESKNINAYLTDGPIVFVENRSSVLSSLPKIGYGSSALDGGFLILSVEEKIELVKNYPSSIKFLKKIVGSQELIKGLERWCIWINDEDLKEALNIEPIAKRINNVKEFRLKSIRQATIDASQNSHRFGEPRFINGNIIIIPKVSSEIRQYLPIGFYSSNIVVLDKAFPIYNTEIWIFSILVSRFHMIWLNSVGGKLETRLSYSSSIVYNTFPFPPITEAQKAKLETHVHHILEQRAKHTEKTLAELYDPAKMPEGLLAAHQNLDIAIEKCYRDKPFTSDEERLAHLFKLYEEMIAAEPLKGTLFEGEVKIKKSKKK